MPSPGAKCRQPEHPTPPAKQQQHTSTTAACAALLAELRALGASDLAVTSSVSLQHLPWDLAAEPALPEKLKGRLAFAVQKLGAIARLAAAAAAAGGKCEWACPPPDSVEEIPAAMFARAEAFAERRAKQPQFPPFPTTTSELAAGRRCLCWWSVSGLFAACSCAVQGPLSTHSVNKLISPPLRTKQQKRRRSRLVPADRAGAAPARAAQGRRDRQADIRAPRRPADRAGDRRAGGPRARRARARRGGAHRHERALWCALGAASCRSPAPAPALACPCFVSLPCPRSCPSACLPPPLGAAPCRCNHCCHSAPRS